MQSVYEPAHINDDELEEIKDLEKSLGKVLVALEKKGDFAQLSEQQLTELQRAEEELGCVVLAYERP